MTTADMLAFIELELERAERMHDPINSLHEGYAIIAEELDEVWDEVRKKTHKRDHAKIRAELVQVAAMAIRTAMDCLEDEA